jgi:hypothetical protein
VSELDELRQRVRDLEAQLASRQRGRPAPKRSLPPESFLEWLRSVGPGTHWVPDHVLGQGLTQQARWSRLCRYCALLLDAVHLGAQWLEWDPVIPDPTDELQKAAEAQPEPKDTALIVTE